MANNDDLNQDQSDQWQPQPGPGVPGQDLPSPSSAPYGLAGQGQMGDAMSRDIDPNLASQMDEAPDQRQSGSNDQGMMAGGYGGNRPDLNQTDQSDLTPAQGAPVRPDAPTDQPPTGDPGMMDDPNQQRSGGSGLVEKLGNLFGRHGGQGDVPDQGNP